MRIIRTLEEMRSAVNEVRRQNGSVGLVPTMGALHAGHLALIEKARKTSDFVVCSIFVNPAQFNILSDLEKYPRNEAKDCTLLSEFGCDAVFIPDVREIYPSTEKPVLLDFGALERTMEGEFRPGHFAGVGLIVSKLFNLVQPQQAFFGRKDLQQLAVIRKLTRDLNFPIEIVPVDTLREPSGLAMSSRNMLFSDDQKKDAAFLHVALLKMKSDLELKSAIKESQIRTLTLLNQKDFITTEYLEVVNAETMEIVDNLAAKSELAICCAAVVHGVRLIDNIIL